jgi:hypothetical protein
MLNEYPSSLLVCKLRIYYNVDKLHSEKGTTKLSAVLCCTGYIVYVNFTFLRYLHYDLASPTFSGAIVCGNLLINNYIILRPPACHYRSITDNSR